jgi:uncharacterized protein YjbI with pentapeptide repeats
MAVMEISESHLNQLLSRHKSWLDAFNQGIAIEDAAQLVLTDVSFPEVNIANADFSNAEIIGCSFGNARFESCEFFYTDFTSSILRNCSFINCKFVKSNFTRVNAAGSKFCGSDFTRADLTDTILQSADLTNSIFDWAWLIRTDLRFAVLEGCRFERARLSGTKLYNVTQFHLGEIAGATVQDVDFSPDGNGAEIIGVEVFDRLNKGLPGSPKT